MFPFYSEIEEKDQILCINQAEALAELSCFNTQGFTSD